jgi:hypothetical protein
VGYRDRGKLAWPQTYMDLSREHWPLNDTLIPIVRDVVTFADAQLNNDADGMLDVLERRRSDRMDKEQADFIEERFPDFVADLNRTREIIDAGGGTKARRSKYLFVS